MGLDNPLRSAAVRYSAPAWLSSWLSAHAGEWSPVSLLYALTAPVLPLLFGSMLIPIIGYAYLASRRADLPRDDS
ncbi:MAG TPA: hypothetical protein DCF65_12415 [Chloroflexi bacterium]|nr:hypothetical protein [Chloroflexota bacterium]HAF18739.1 hypothetical protein [Chloroflexota bacterium]